MSEFASAELIACVELGVVEDTSFEELVVAGSFLLDDVDEGLEEVVFSGWSRID